VFFDGLRIRTKHSSSGSMLVNIMVTSKIWKSGCHMWLWQVD